jgi:hypothetical protein
MKGVVFLALPPFLRQGLAVDTAVMLDVDGEEWKGYRDSYTTMPIRR